MQNSYDKHKTGQTRYNKPNKSHLNNSVLSISLKDKKKIDF